MTVASRYDERKLYNRVPIPGANIHLPWPMTRGEIVGYSITTLGLAVVGIVATWWGALALIGPSLWRFAPTIVWLIVWRLWALPSIVRLLKPSDLEARWAAFSERR